MSAEQNRNLRDGTYFIVKSTNSWKNPTIHIYWTPQKAKDSDTSIAFCRESVEGRLKHINEIFPLKNSKISQDQFCEQCINKAQESAIIEMPKKLKNID